MEPARESGSPHTVDADELAAVPAAMEPAGELRDGQFRVMRMHRYSVMPQCSPPVSSGTTMTCCRPEMISRSSRNGAAGER
jgi:hypothetical protein